MKKFFILLILAIVIIIIVYFLFINKKTEPMKTTTNNVIKATIETAKGNIELDLYPDVAPNTVDNFVKLSKSGFYDNTRFHRVVEDFVIQGGDPLSKDPNAENVGTGGPGYKFNDEINPKSLGLSDELISQLEQNGYTFDYNLQSIPHKIGTISMANSGPNTNGSQFFIVSTQDQPNLNGMYTAFGQVTKGMDIVQSIKQGDIIKKIIINN